ncbi:FemAB family XrtA/PEP-CTERM system-associated protein [Aliivibrio kagoshimensis]|uniref:FemAB family XrtA/PEP-CTERM system-associated protein n=1 Tax=Aliivibrio kagoshimensis TaxID=2910230 RepID=UPI003D12D352
MSHLSQPAINIVINNLQPSLHAAWDRYVEGHEQGSFFHYAAWSSIATDVFNHSSHYLIAQQDDTIVGVLPLIEQKSMLFGHALISTPFCAVGGTLADNDYVRRQLENEALAIGRELSVDYVELRDQYPCEFSEPWQLHCKHANFSAPIADDNEQILTSIKRKQRAVVRHSLKNDLIYSNEDNVDVCFNLYAQSVRNLGTPVFSKLLFVKLKEYFGERCETVVIYNADQQPISSVMNFYFQDTVLPYYAGSSDLARQYKSHDFMYYQLMCHAKESGCQHFDFGRSKVDSGSYKFKRNWGFSEQKLYYRIALINAVSLPNLSPNNPKYQLLIKAWKKLPLPISNFIGPFLSKYLG